MTQHYTCATAAVHSVRLAPTAQVKTAWMGDQPCSGDCRACIENLPMELQEPNFLFLAFRGDCRACIENMPMKVQEPNFLLLAKRTSHLGRNSTMKVSTE